MGLVSIKWLNMSKHSHFGSTKGLFAPFVLGVSFALGWTPCIGPIFAAIVSMAAQGAGTGLTLMGVVVPFKIRALSVKTDYALIQRLVPAKGFVVLLLLCVLKIILLILPPMATEPLISVVEL